MRSPAGEGDIEKGMREDGAAAARRASRLAQQKIGQTQLDWQVAGLQVKVAQGQPDRHSCLALAQ
jgi:hypothetical protein